MIELELHDDTPAGPGEKHGPGGPTHAGSVRVDSEYQVDVWLSDIEHDHKDIVRIVSKDLGREWKRNALGAFEEVE
jgi:hypothetical protein